MDYKDIISNVNVYGLPESIVASGYPMLVNPYSSDEFTILTANTAKVTENLSDNHNTSRALKLANTKMK